MLCEVLGGSWEPSLCEDSMLGKMSGLLKRWAWLFLLECGQSFKCNPPWILPLRMLKMKSLSIMSESFDLFGSLSFLPVLFKEHSLFC